MGDKGARQTSEATAVAETLVAELAELGPVRSKAMFGGHGIYCEDTMFALVNSAGVAHLRVDDDLAEELEEAGGTRHGRMPYVSVDLDEHLVPRARRALAVARAAKG